MSSAKCFVCYDFQVTLNSFESGGILSECQTAWIRVRREAELLGVLSWSKLFAYGTLVVIGRIRVNCRGGQYFIGGQFVIRGVNVLYVRESKYFDPPGHSTMTGGSVYYIVLWPGSQSTTGVTLLHYTGLCMAWHVRKCCVVMPIYMPLPFIVSISRSQERVTDLWVTCAVQPSCALTTPYVQICDVICE